LAQRQPKISVNVFKVVEAGDDLAVLYNDWTTTTKSTDGSYVEITHKAIEVVRRQPDGTWLFVFDDPFARD
jgi:ketosteroid isomerase-like protein